MKNLPTKLNEKIKVKNENENGTHTGRLFYRQHRQDFELKGIEQIQKS